MNESGRCFLCGQPHIGGGRVCATCAALAERGELPPLAGAQVRVKEMPVETEIAAAAAARQRVQVPLPPQIREERENQVRRTEEEGIRQAALKNAEALAGRWREQERIAAAELQRVAGTITCPQCGEVNGGEGVRFSFCVHCGTDLPGVASNARREEASLPLGVRSPRTTMRKIAQLHQQTQRQTETQTAAATSASPSVAGINPGLNAALSFFFPGAGQLLNGQIAKGVCVILAAFLATTLFSPWGVPMILGRVVCAIDALRIARRRQQGQSVADYEWDLG